VASAAQTAGADLERKFTATVRPFLNSYCVGCHSGVSPASQLELKQYTTIASVARDYTRWNLVIDKLTAGAMPPKVAPQPSAEARQQVIDWVRAVRETEARKN